MSDDEYDEYSDEFPGAIGQAFDDNWHFRVTLSDGRKFVCGSMSHGFHSSFVTLRPVESSSNCKWYTEMPFEGHFECSKNKLKRPDEYVLTTRCVDVAWAHIVSVEIGIS